VQGAPRFRDVRGPPTQAKLDLALPRHAAATSIARREVVRCFSVRLHEQLVADMTITVNELVSNALTHGVGGIRLLIYDLGDHVRLEVSDEGDGFLVPHDPLSHKGLAIVDQLADQWGVRSGSTHVWCSFIVSRH